MSNVPQPIPLAERHECELIGVRTVGEALDTLI
jgi:hypothetical protein